RQLAGIDGLGIHAPLSAIHGMAETGDKAVVIKQAAAPEVAEDVIRLDFVGRVIAPGLRVTDSYVESGELGLGSGLSRGIHPGEGINAAPESGDDVRNHGFDLGLGFGWEVALGVHFPDGVAEHAAACKHSVSSFVHHDADHRDAALPARAAPRLAGEGLAEEVEALVGERFGQYVGVILNQVEGQPVSPRVEFRGSNESRLSGEGRRLPHDEAGLATEAGAAKVRCPVEAGGACGEVSLLPGVVRLVDVVLIRQWNVFFGDGVLQFDDVLGADVRVGESGKLEQSGNVPLIFGADVTHALAVGKVVFAVGHFQAALQQVGGPTLWVVEAGRYPQPEKVGGMKVVEVRAERSEAFGFDGDSVHVGVVDVGNFAGIGTSSRIGLGCCFDQASDTLADQVVRAIEVEAVWSN